MKPVNSNALVLAWVITWVFLSAPASHAETVSIIAEDDWYPYAAKVGDAPNGIAVDIVRAAFAAQGVDVAFEVMNYDRGMRLVKDGMNIACFDAPRTGEIENYYYWHDERLFAAESFIFARADFQGNVREIRDLAGKRVGLTEGYGYGNTVDLDTGMIKEYSTSDSILIRKLTANALDCIILFDKVADYLLPKLNVSGKVRAVAKADTSDIFVAFSKVHPEGKKYCDIFSGGFRKIKSDGTYQRILSDWDAQLKAASSPSDP